ncbi:hypothetical protein GCM10009827_071530 [Dactylosporangium maewongense]|uniref:Uncharacterized protein n=1 Tax=Dactylosporangium maewongense TaxID=634393 RepID=A0ABN2BIH5_9ACTN
MGWVTRKATKQAITHTAPTPWLIRTVAEDLIWWGSVSDRRSLRPDQKRKATLTTPSAAPATVAVTIDQPRSDIAAISLWASMLTPIAVMSRSGSTTIVGCRSTTFPDLRLAIPHHGRQFRVWQSRVGQRTNRLLEPAAGGVLGKRGARGGASGGGGT